MRYKNLRRAGICMAIKDLKSQIQNVHDNETRTDHNTVHFYAVSNAVKSKY